MPCKIHFQFVIFLCVALVGCNKNPHELPVQDGLLKKRSISVEVGGFPAINFILEQTLIDGPRVPKMDTIWISIQNKSDVNITSIEYIVELCKRDSVGYDGCVIFFNQQWNETIKPDSISRRLHYLPNKQITLDDLSIYGGVISLNGVKNNPLANVYGSGYASFQTDTAISTSAFYGFVRGYILSDGHANFRLKSSLNINYNAEGSFVDRSNYTGLFGETGLSQLLFRLDTLRRSPSPMLINTSVPNEVSFRIKLTRPVLDSIKYVSVISKKTF